MERERGYIERYFRGRRQTRFEIAAHLRRVRQFIEFPDSLLLHVGIFINAMKPGGIAAITAQHGENTKASIGMNTIVGKINDR